jgi:hypothetical protein
MLKSITKKQTVYFLFIVVALLVSFQLVLRGSRDFDSSGFHYTHYNNYLIFKQSFSHLIDGKDLYASYPAEHWDLYKYTPLFALSMGVFQWVPDSVGLILWNVLNALVLFGGIYALPRLTLNQKFTVSLLVLLELITSLQNAQSNALLVGLILYAFAYAERGKMHWATLFVVLSVFIKLYGVIAFLMFLFYPNKWKSALYAGVWTVLGVLLPMFVVGWNQNLYLFQQFLGMLKSDHDASYGLSVMGIIHGWTKLEVSKLGVLLVGVVLLLWPYLRWKTFVYDAVRHTLVVLLLMWMVLFNHKAESPTFIIAVVAMAWAFALFPEWKLFRATVLVCIAVTSLSPTDLVPAFIRNNYVNPLVIKAVPSLVVFVWLTVKSKSHPRFLSR